MSLSLRKHEIQALRQLVEAHTNGPDEWGPEHHAVAGSAAGLLAEALRRHDRSEGARDAAKASRKPQRSRQAILTVVADRVKWRSGGFCEARTPACPDGRHYAVHMHQRLRRSQGGEDKPENLLYLCAAAHDYIHANPEESYRMGWLIRGVR